MDKKTAEEISFYLVSEAAKAANLIKQGKRKLNDSFCLLQKILDFSNLDIEEGLKETPEEEIALFVMTKTMQAARLVKLGQKNRDDSCELLKTIALFAREGWQKILIPSLTVEGAVAGSYVIIEAVSPDEKAQKTETRQAITLPPPPPSYPSGPGVYIKVEPSTQRSKGREDDETILLDT